MITYTKQDILDMLETTDSVSVEVNNMGGGYPMVSRFSYTIDGQDVLDNAKYQSLDNNFLPAREDEMSSSIKEIDVKDIITVKPSSGSPLREDSIDVFSSNKTVKEMTGQLREAEMVEQYQRFSNAVAKKKFGANSIDELEEPIRAECKLYVEKLWPKYEKKHLKSETTGMSANAGYLTPIAFTGGKKSRAASFAKSQGYSVDSDTPHADPIHESYYFSNSNLTAEQKVDIALKEIKETMIKTEQLVRHTLKLKQENNAQSSLYSKKTNRSLKHISERAIRLMSMLENIK
jgi:hypothetical protein